MKEEKVLNIKFIIKINLLKITISTNLSIKYADMMELVDV